MYNLLSPCVFLYLTSGNITIVVDGIVEPQCKHSAELSTSSLCNPHKRGSTAVKQTSGALAHTATPRSFLLSWRQRLRVVGWEKHRETKATPSESPQDEEKKRGKQTDAQEKVMYSTNHRSPPLNITLAAVANQSSTHASCTVTLASSQAGGPVDYKSKQVV